MHAQVDRLWKILCPLIRMALSNVTVETYTDWGTCIATACVSHSLAYTYIYCMFVNFTYKNDYRSYFLGINILFNKPITFLSVLAITSLWSQ